MRRVQLRPALLKDGKYVLPFACLEVEQLWCGRREVWTPSHGRATRYHVMVDGGVAACRRNLASWHGRKVILISEGTLLPLVQIPASQACLRNGCRQIFEAYLA